MARPSRREEVLHAARKLFLKDGYEHVTVRGISLACNMTTGAIYTHFLGKADVLGILAQEVWDITTGCIEQAMQNSNHPYQSMRVMQGYQDFANRFPDHFDLLMYLGDHPEVLDDMEEEKCKKLMEQRMHTYSLAFQAIDADKAAGLLPQKDTRMMMMAFTGITTGLMKQRKRDVSNLIATEHTEVEAWALELIFKGLQNKDES